MSLIIKIFLIEDWDKEPTQIRRFAWDTGLKYNDLCEKILNLYPALIGTDLLLKWKDEEGDWIDISSDTELLDAAKACEGHLLKLWVATEKKPSESKTHWFDFQRDMLSHYRGGRGRFRGGKGCGKEYKNTHWGYACDGCNGAIVGSRFHCRTCPDYDLCQACFDVRTHPDHSMVEIRSPKRGRRSCSREMEKEYLQGVGEDVATMLAPLDINVDVEVEERPNLDEKEAPAEEILEKTECPCPPTAPEPSNPQQPIHPNPYLHPPPPQFPHYFPFALPRFSMPFMDTPGHPYDPMGPHPFEQPAAYPEPPASFPDPPVSLIPEDMSSDEKQAMETLREMGFDITNHKLVQNVRKNKSDVQATIHEMLKN